MAASTYGVPEVKSKIYCNKTATYDMDNVTSQNLPTFDLKPGTNVSKTYYGVRIVNGSQAASGTNDKGINVVLVGTDGCTEKLYLSGFFSVFGGVSSASKYEDIVVQTNENLGDVQVFIYGNDKNWTGLFDNEWYVEFSMVYPLSSKGNSTEFPCYHWIGDGETISTTSETILSRDVTSDILKRQRENQLRLRKTEYVWEQYSDTGLPSGIDETKSAIPSDEQFGVVKNLDFNKNLLVGAASMGVDLLTIDTVDSLQDFIDLADNLDTRYTPLYESSRWVSDVEFGRQILNGVNPIILEKFKTIPSKFPVTQEMLAPFLTRGKTLQQEMSEGRVYICDMEIMDGLTPREGFVAPAPICLLYVNSANQLVPIAIQIKQGLREEERDEPNPIFVPNDSWIDWLIAKIYYRAADSQYHQLYTHYLSCHATMEAYSMGVMRNLPDAHPIHKLLRPHFRYTMAINSRARKTLISVGGPIDRAFGIGGEGKIRLIQKASGLYSVNSTNIKKNTKLREVDDATQLPGYYYRDDGYLVWDTTEKYVTDVINKFYSSDKDVKGDQELQKFADDLYTYGFPNFYGGTQGHDFPPEILKKDDLIEHCTRIIFTGSSQHAAVNFGQYQMYSFVPNAPFAVRAPPPTEKGKANYQTLLSTLPDKTSAALGIILTYSLSQYGPNEIFLGKYPAERFIETDIKQFVRDFQDGLQKINTQIDERNQKLDMPYTYMQPKAVPNSITI